MAKRNTTKGKKKTIAVKQHSRGFDPKHLPKRASDGRFKGKAGGGRRRRGATGLQLPLIGG